MAGQTQQLFRNIQNGCLKNMKLSKAQIQDLVKKFLKERIEKYNKPVAYTGYVDEWSDDDEWNPNWSLEDEHPKHSSTLFNNQEGLEETINFIDEIKADLNTKLQNGRYRMAGKRADRLLAKEGFMESDIDRTSPSYVELCSGIYRAWIKSLDYWQQKLTGKYSDELEGVLDGFLSDETSEESREEEKKIDPILHNPPSLSSSKTISQVIDEYVEEKAREKQWATEKSQDKAKTGMKLLVEYFGDIPINTVDRQMMAQFKRDLWKIPPNRNKVKAYRDLTLRKQIALNLPPKQCIAENTVSDYLSRAISLLDHARLNGDIPTNPAEGMTIKKKKRTDENRDSFTSEDLGKIFNSDQYQEDTFTKSYRFWTPLLAIFTGARQNEMAQLHLSDFEQHEGIWCIKLIGDTEDKKLKNNVSKRLIPLHPFLVEDLKIIARVNWLKERGEKRLFPELTLNRDGYGRAVSRWFSDYLKPIGVYVKHRKTFHSFRHTFGSNLAHNNINDHNLKALMGHSEDSITFGTYVKRGTPTKLYSSLVNHLKYDLDLSHLKNSKYVIK